MTAPTYPAKRVAEYFLSLADPEDNDISNLKLQKLCYYAQGLCTAMRGAPLFAEPIEAWDHGPVVPDLYHAFKQHGSQPIPVVLGFDPHTMAKADRRALDDIYGYYGQFSAWRLRNMTHNEPPWRDAYNAGHCDITVAALLDYFRQQVDDDYVKGIYG